MTDVVEVRESAYHHRTWTSPDPATAAVHELGQTRKLSPELDQVQGAGHNPYTYPVDPINGYDLNGMCWSGWGWACSAAHWVAKNRSTIAGVVATGACVFGGPVACGVAQAAAWAVRSQQRGWSHYRTNIEDGILTGASYGTGQALRWAGQNAYPSAWGAVRPIHQYVYKAAINWVPAATNWYARRAYSSNW
jgi:hypothetical protein